MIPDDLADEAAYWDNLTDEEMDALFEQGETVQLVQRPFIQVWADTGLQGPYRWKVTP